MKKKTKDSQRNKNWMPLECNDESYVAFNQFRRKSGLTVSEYFASVNFYLSDLLEKHGIGFITYYSKRLNEDKEAQAEQWRKTREANKKRKRSKIAVERKKVNRLYTHRDILHEILEQIQERFNDLGKFRLYLAIEYFVLNCKAIAGELNLQKGTSNGNPENRRKK